MRSVQTLLSRVLLGLGGGGCAFAPRAVPVDPNVNFAADGSVGVG